MTEFLAVILSWPVVTAAALIYFRDDIRQALRMFTKARRATLPNGAAIDFHSPPLGQAELESLELITGRSFISALVPLDGKNYSRCRFENCIFEYAGDAVFELSGNDFMGTVQFTFTGAAARVSQTLSAIYTGMGPIGPNIVESFFDRVRNPQPTAVAEPHA